MEEERNLPKEAYESLPEEEKDKLNKFEKKGVITAKAKYDAKSGEKLSEETEYNSEYKRKKGTFCISCPEELVRLCSQSKIRAINKMLAYVIYNCNYKNEIIFDKSFISTYPNINKFYEDRKFLLNNQYIFHKPNKKNVYTINVELLSRGNAFITSQLYEEQFETKLDNDSKTKLNRITKQLNQFTQEDLKYLYNYLKKIIKW